MSDAHSQAVDAFLAILAVLPLAKRRHLQPHVRTVGQALKLGTEVIEQQFEARPTGRQRILYEIKGDNTRERFYMSLEEVADIAGILPASLAINLRRNSVYIAHDREIYKGHPETVRVRRGDSDAESVVSKPPRAAAKSSKVKSNDWRSVPQQVTRKTRGVRAF